jgi:hypothetical protein
MASDQQRALKSRVEAAKTKIHAQEHGYNSGALLKQFQKLLALLTEECFSATHGGDSLKMPDQNAFRISTFQKLCLELEDCEDIFGTDSFREFWDAMIKPFLEACPTPFQNVEAAALFHKEFPSLTKPFTELEASSIVSFRKDTMLKVRKLELDWSSFPPLRSGDEDRFEHLHRFMLSVPDLPVASGPLGLKIPSLSILWQNHKKVSRRILNIFLN